MGGLRFTFAKASVNLRPSMYYVYLLKLSNDSVYTGCTPDLKRRIQEHETGKTESTKDLRPLKLIWYCAFPSRIQARRFEQYLNIPGVWDVFVYHVHLQPSFFGNDSRTPITLSRSSLSPENMPALTLSAVVRPARSCSTSASRSFCAAVICPS